MELKVTVPFTSKDLREASLLAYRESVRLAEASKQLEDTADAMDGTSPVAKLVDLADPPGVKTVNGATDGAHVGPPRGPTDDDYGPLNAAEAFAPPPVPTAAAPPPPPPPVPAADAELDSKGAPWTQGVHADNKSKKQDGTWKARRGGTKSPATNRADGGPAIDDVDLKTFQTAMGKLIAAGVDLDMITKSVSQTAFGDMDRTTGGIEHVLAADDAKLTGKAFNALKAVALQTGNGSAF